MEGPHSIPASPVNFARPDARATTFLLLHGGALVFFGCMRVLFAISLVAFAALLWASFSIVRFVRQARRRQRAVRQDVNLPSAPTGAPAPPLAEPASQSSSFHLSPVEHGRR